MRVNVCCVDTAVVTGEHFRRHGVRVRIPIDTTAQLRNGRYRRVTKLVVAGALEDVN